MNDRFIDAELLFWKKKYWVEIIENISSYHIEKFFKEHWVIEQVNSSYNVLEQVNWKSFWVAYCIKYRPLWMTERILQRWRRNDKGIWTADWIFNDWKI